MDIQHSEKDGRGIFYVTIDGKQLAEMVYSLKEPDLMVIEHTEVDDVLRGKNMGAQLVHTGAEYARQKHFTIIPLCPFANAYFKKKHDEYQDVLRK